MGARGPKPGFKQAREGAATPLSFISEPIPAAVALSSTDLENPDKLDGEPLRELAYRRGLSRSALTDMSDEKIRRELRFITHRQYEEEVA